MNSSNRLQKELKQTSAVHKNVIDRATKKRNSRIKEIIVYQQANRKDI